MALRNREGHHRLKRELIVPINLHNDRADQAVNAGGAGNFLLLGQSLQRGASTLTGGHSEFVLIGLIDDQVLQNPLCEGKPATPPSLPHCGSCAHYVGFGPVYSAG